MTNKAQGIGGLVIAAVYVGYHFTQPRHGGAYSYWAIKFVASAAMDQNANGLIRRGRAIARWLPRCPIRSFHTARQGSRQHPRPPVRVTQ
jgi:hypothetical protein